MSELLWFLTGLLTFPALVVVFQVVDGWTMRNWCPRPKVGYYCTYAKGHLGECDEWPTQWTAAKERLRGR